MFKYDYHVHTRYSHDSDVNLDDYCLKAVGLGIDELGFSDHLDLDPRDPGCGYYDWKRFGEDFAEIKARFSSQITLKKGIEITYQEEFRGLIEKIVSEGSYDYTLSGIHLAKGVFYTGYWCEAQLARFDSASSAFKNYFEELENSVKSGLIDIVAHIDVIKRHGERVFGKLNPADFKTEYDSILKIMVDNDIALEINAGEISNFRREFLYPDDWIINRYRSLGGKLVTFGSDSHSVDALFGGYSQAMKKAREFGFDSWCVFDRRNRSLMKFSDV